MRNHSAQNVSLSSFDIMKNIWPNPHYTPLNTECK